MARATFGLLLSSTLLASSFALASPPPSVAADASFNISKVTGIVYAQGLIDVGTPKQRAAARFVRRRSSPRTASVPSGDHDQIPHSDGRGAW